MNDFTPNSSVIGGLTKIPLDPEEDVFGGLWKQAVDDFIAQAQLSNDEKAWLFRNPYPEEAFTLTQRRWNNLSEKQLRRHENAQRAVERVLGIFGLIDSALGLAQVVDSIYPKFCSNVGIPCGRSLLRCSQNSEPSFSYRILYANFLRRTETLRIYTTLSRNNSS